ncbi:hypothetical protein A5320_02860 [Rheinheimera sp. SA_1]|uniref:DUF7010 family protein n=1 Tax=Rheinheimera sp. SA_1 TaxID=1827365 RepID=UPI0007FD5DD0|nr:hypothetical protein [Rheinheimera sp. SA_1]OBP16366.1 hypothetical protein A5320_02860 [Rheinheimera sp. SA_1]
MNNQATSPSKSLDTQLAEFRNRRFLATPLAGTIIWSLLILTGAFLPPTFAVWAVFIGTGSIIYLALGLAKLTGESMKFQKGSERNFFDTLFLSAVGMSFLVYALAIPFFLEDYRSLPFTVAVLAGIMWSPVSVLLQHWVGVFHGVVRTVLCTAAWVIAPEHSFILQPVIVVAVYLVSIMALEQRWRSMQAEVGTVSADCTLRNI